MGKKTKVHVAFLLDESGSMHATMAQTIAGFDQYINGLKEDDNGKYRLTLVKFNSEQITTLYSNESLKNVSSLAGYKPDNYTPLYDAIMDLIDETKPKDDWNVLFVIMTDGLENASRKYTLEDVKKRIAEKKEEGWNFIFLGANIDSFEVGSSLGVPWGNTANYVQGQEQETFRTVVLNTISYTSSGGGKTGDFFDGNTDRNPA